MREYALRVSEPTEIPSDSTERARTAAPALRWAWLLPVLGAFVLWAPGIASGSIVNGDDAIYAVVLRSLAEGAPAAQTLGWRPPLFYLLGWSTLSALGPTELALRLPSLVCGLLAVFATWRAGRALFESRPAIAIGAAMLVAASGQFFLFARRVRGLDLLLTAVLALAVAVAANAGKRLSRWALVGALLGLAVWTKSVVVVVIGPALAVLWWTECGEMRTRIRAAATVAVTSGVVGGAWFVWMKLAGASAHVQDHVQNHVARRAEDATVVAAEHSPVTFYLEQLLSLEGVFGLLGLGALAWLAVRAARKGRSEGVVLAWVLGVLVPFSLVSTKLPHYMLPAYPALALAIAVACDAVLARVASAPARDRLAVATLGALSVTMLLASPVAVLSGWGFADYSPHLKAGAAAAEEVLDGGGTLAVWNEYHVAADFYFDGQALLWTDNSGFYSAYATTHGFVDGVHFARVSAADAARELVAAAPACLLVRDDRRSAAIESVFSAGLVVRQVPGATLACATEGKAGD